MMGIINMAHGEFIAMGGYVTTYSYHAGVPLALAMLIGAVACGLFGVFLERTIVRRFYHRPIDSLVATWGISLIMTQGALLLLGSGAPGVGTPFGSVSFGGASFSVYRLVLVAVAVAVLVGLYLLFMKTRFGRHARATMQNAAMARALGVPVNKHILHHLRSGCGTRRPRRRSLCTDDDAQPDDGCAASSSRRSSPSWPAARTS